MQKNKQLICYFIALFIFVSGMCFENLGANSLSLRATRESVYTSLSERNISAMEARTEEIAGNNRTARIIGVQNQSTQQVRRTLRLFCSYLLGLVSVAIAQKIYMAEESVFLEKADCHTAVLNYIHNTDGKKRI